MQKSNKKSLAAFGSKKVSSALAVFGGNTTMQQSGGFLNVGTHLLKSGDVTNPCCKTCDNVDAPDKERDF